MGLGPHISYTCVLLLQGLVASGGARNLSIAYHRRNCDLRLSGFVLYMIEEFLKSSLYLPTHLHSLVLPYSRCPVLFRVTVCPVKSTLRHRPKGCQASPGHVTGSSPLSYKWKALGRVFLVKREQALTGVCSGFLSFFLPPSSCQECRHAAQPCNSRLASTKDGDRER